MDEASIIRCQINKWYTRFHKISLKTILHPLPESFVDFLLDDGALILPESTADGAFPNRLQITGAELQAEGYSPWSTETTPEQDHECDDDDDDGDDVIPRPPPSFTELEIEVRASIEALGGSVFPKLNWSAPKDTAWISTNGTLKCSSFSEILLLLKASDTLVHDLMHAFDSCHDTALSRPPTFYLALRKWYDLHPEMEFRVFVKLGFIVGVSQREITGYYPALLPKKSEIEELVFSFFVENINGKFECDQYVFDCYVTKDGRVKLVDFGPWGGFTLPLLFTWEELERNYDRVLERIEEVCGVGERTLVENFERLRLGLDDTELCVKIREKGHCLDFRVVESEGCVQPNLRASSGVPYDYIDTSDGSAWDEFLRRTDHEVRKQASAAGG